MKNIPSPKPGDVFKDVYTKELYVRPKYQGFMIHLQHINKELKKKPMFKNRMSMCMYRSIKKNER